MQYQKPSRKQLRKLGERIRKDCASDDDWAALASFRAAHIPSLCDTLKSARGLVALQAVRPKLSARIKNTATIREKLPKSTLGMMQDIAGVRIVIDGGRAEQDRVSDELLRSGALTGASRDDLRSNPSSGYRAVHVIGQCDGYWVEVQVRTLLQHNWAQMYERLADILGRQIRYGKTPDEGAALELKGATIPRGDIVDRALSAADSIADAELNASEASIDDAYLELRDFKEVLDALKQGREQLPSLSRLSVSDLDAAWYLVVHFRREGFTIRQPFEDEDEMRDIWQHSEEEYRGNPNVEVVLLVSASSEDLESTHERYFNSSPGFQR